MFKKHLEEMPEDEALLNNTELNLIFGKLPPIYETHVKMLDEFRWTSAHWNEERSIGNIIVKYSAELLKAYPQYINYFEEMKEVLLQCDQNKPRFHAFLKACQTKPECGRQSLQELMIRPVQRLGSISLLLNGKFGTILNESVYKLEYVILLFMRFQSKFVLRIKLVIDDLTLLLYFFFFNKNWSCIA